MKEPRIRIEFNGNHLEGFALLSDESFVLRLDDTSFYKAGCEVERFGGATLAEGIAYGQLFSFSRLACDFLRRLSDVAMRFCAEQGRYCFSCQRNHVGHPVGWPCCYAGIQDVRFFRKAK